MGTDEQSIRDLIATWMAATARGDLVTITTLMAEDVVFLLPGQPPMRGRLAFADSFQAALAHMSINATSTVQEIQISGDMAYCWNQLTVAMTPRQGGAAMHRSGYTLTVLRKQADGNWVVSRDANLLTAQP